MCGLIDLFIAPSQFLRNEFIRFGIPKEKIKFVPYGIETESFGGSKKEPSDKVRFGFIGTILPAKGVDILIQAFNKIKDRRVELKIYGKLFPYRGFEYYPGFIKKLVKNESIQFMGGFNHEDVSAIFSEIDVLFFPSIWNENCPLTILEAFASKTPVIASRIGGVPELVDDGVNGLLFNPGDADDLYRKMQRVIENADILGKLKGKIPEVKNMETNAKEMEEIYNKLVGKNEEIFIS